MPVDVEQLDPVHAIVFVMVQIALGCELVWMKQKIKRKFIGYVRINVNDTRLIIKHKRLQAEYSHRGDVSLFLLRFKKQIEESCGIPDETFFHVAIESVTDDIDLYLKIDEDIEQYATLRLDWCVYRQGGAGKTPIFTGPLPAIDLITKDKTKCRLYFVSEVSSAVDIFQLTIGHVDDGCLQSKVHIEFYYHMTPEDYCRDIPSMNKFRAMLTDSLERIRPFKLIVHTMTPKITEASMWAMLGSKVLSLLCMRDNVNEVLLFMGGDGDDQYIFEGICVTMMRNLLFYMALHSRARESPVCMLSGIDDEIIKLILWGSGC